jgi:ribosomal protein S18 acetylase RimI-like enzyme
VRLVDVVIVEMAAHDLGRIGEIDRSEQVSVLYVHEHGELRAVQHELDIPTWSEQEIAASVRKLEPKLAVGGTLVAAIDAGRLVGVGVLGGSFPGELLDELEVAFLHVSSGHRRRGIATRLMDALEPADIHMTFDLRPDAAATVD